MKPSICNCCKQQILNRLKRAKYCKSCYRHLSYRNAKIANKYISIKQKSLRKWKKEFIEKVKNISLINSYNLKKKKLEHKWKKQFIEKIKNLI